MSAEVEFEVNSVNADIDMFASGYIANGFSINVNSGRQLTAGIGQGGVAAAVTTSVNSRLVLGTRYKAHLTWTGSVVGAYLNGTSVGSAATATSSLTRGAFDKLFEAPAKYYSLRYWSRALTAAEVAARNANDEVDGSSLILNADFSRPVTNSGDVLVDRSPAANNLTMVGSFTWPGSLYPLYYGKVTNFTVSPEWGNRVAIVEAGDDVDRLLSSFISTSLFINTNASSLFTVVMSAAGVNSFAVESENSMNDTILFAWADDERISDMVDRITGFGDFATFEDGAGTFRLRSRHWQQGAISIASYSATDKAFERFEFSVSQESVRNRVIISSQPRVPRTAVGTIGWIQEQAVIPGSSSISFEISFIDTDDPNTQAPALGIVTPVRSLDWKLNASSGGTGVDLTSVGSLQFTAYGATAICSLFNGGSANAYVTLFTIRGISAQAQPPLGAQNQSNSSQALYARREFTINNDLLSNQLYLQGYAEYLISVYKEPTPEVKFGLKNQFPDILGRELGDIIALSEPRTAVSSQWQIIAINHEISLGGGLEHSVSYDVRQHPDRQWLILDDPTRGKLDSNNKLGF